MGAHTTLIFHTFLHFMIRQRSRDFGWGTQPLIKQVLLLTDLRWRTTAGGSTCQALRHTRSTFPLPITTGAPYTLPTTNCDGRTLCTLTLYSATTNHHRGAPNTTLWAPPYLPKHHPGATLNTLLLSTPTPQLWSLYRFRLV